jgi:pyruvate-formate lyase
MVEFVHPQTGEVANIPTADLINYEPVGPLELEQLIREVGDRLENAVPVIKELWGRRYQAERNFIEARAKALMRSKESSVTRQRAEADLATMQQKNDFDDAKEILHAAEELQKALTSKLYGYLNLNKAQAAAYMGAGIGRT